MDEQKRKNLEAAGWRLGDAEEFLDAISLPDTNPDNVSANEEQATAQEGIRTSPANRTHNWRYEDDLSK